MKKTEFRKELDALLEKNAKFNRTSKDYANMLEKRNKFDNIKQAEWESFRNFYFKYAHYINKDKTLEVSKLFDDAERFDILLKEKLCKLESEKYIDIDKAMKLGNLSINQKIKTFNTIYDLIDNGLKERESKGTIDSLEANLFKIELDKRNSERNTFLKLKEDRIKELSDLNYENSVSVPSKYLTKDKDVSSEKNASGPSKSLTKDVSSEKNASGPSKSLTKDVSSEKSATLSSKSLTSEKDVSSQIKVSSPVVDPIETSNTGKEVSQEIYDIAQEILSMLN